MKNRAYTSPKVHNGWFVEVTSSEGHVLKFYTRNFTRAHHYDEHKEAASLILGGPVREVGKHGSTGWIWKKA